MAHQRQIFYAVGYQLIHPYHHIIEYVINIYLLKFIFFFLSIQRMCSMFIDCSCDRKIYEDQSFKTNNSTSAHRNIVISSYSNDKIHIFIGVKLLCKFIEIINTFILTVSCYSVLQIFVCYRVDTITRVVFHFI